MAALGLGWGLLVVGWLGPAVPVGAFQPLREGFSLDHLRMVAGDSLDTGPLVDVLWRPLLGGPPSYRAFVTVNLCMSGWAALLLGALAWRQGPVAAALLAVCAARSPGAFHAAFSELNGPTAAVYLLLTACLFAEATAWDARRPRLAAAGAALTALALPWLRAELAAVTAAVWLGLAAHALGADRRLAPLLARLAPLLGWRGLVLLAGWVGLSWAVYDPVSRPMREWDWLLRAVHPLHVHGLTLPLALIGVLPPGALLLAAAGAKAALRRPFAHAGLPLVLVVLYATCRLAAHGTFTLRDEGAVARWELYRYLVPLLPLVWVLAVRGLESRVRLTGLLLCLVPAAPELSGLLRLEPVDGPGWSRSFGVAADGPDEVRALVAGAERWPDCALLTSGFDWRGRPTPERERWAAVVPGPRGLRYVERGVPASASPEEAARALAPEAACVRVWRSIDCGQEASAGCPVLRGGTMWQRRPFLHPEHGGRWGAAPLRVGWETLRGGAP